MKMTYDATVDAAYIKLDEQQDDTIFSYTYCCDPSEVDGQIHLDFDINGRIIGIEILSASFKLPKSLIDKYAK